MKLSREEIDHIGVLARLGLSEHDKEQLGEQLSNILENMEALKEIDTSGVPPTAQSITLNNVFRDDLTSPSLAREAVMANAPQQEDGSFKVRPVFE